MQTKTESEIIHIFRYSFNANNHNIFKYIDDIKILELIFQHTDINMEFFNNEFRCEKTDKLIGHPYKEKLYKENKEELFRQDTKLKTFELLSQSNLDKLNKLSGIGYTVEDFETYLIQQNKSHLYNHLHNDLVSRKNTRL